jgi:hypothetical protein
VADLSGAGQVRGVELRVGDSSHLVSILDIVAPSQVDSWGERSSDVQGWLRPEKLVDALLTCGRRLLSVLPWEMAHIPASNDLIHPFKHKMWMSDHERKTSVREVRGTTMEE